MNVLLTWNPDAHVWTLEGHDSCCVTSSVLQLVGCLFVGCVTRHAVGYPTLRHLKGAFPSLMVAPANPACALDDDAIHRPVPLVASYESSTPSSVGVGLLVRAFEGNLNDRAAPSPPVATAGTPFGVAAAAGDFYIMPPPAPVLGPTLSRGSSRGSASATTALEATLLPMPPPKARVLSRLASDSSTDSTTAYTSPVTTSLFH
jgi:hypothetical protein